VFSTAQRDMVTVMRANGDALATICSLVGVTEKTLRKHFKKELDGAFEDVLARMGARLVGLAMGGNVNALKFWLATHGGAQWRLPTDAEGNGGGGFGDDGDDAEPVRFYMPGNGRDQAERIEEEGPLIEGGAEEEEEAA
jgi:hypothetical protein